MTAESTPNTSDNSTNTQETGGVFEQLVGPGKKFQTQEDLAKGKLNSDEFVVKLTDETRQLRESMRQLLQENETLRTKASILDRINPQSSGTPNDPASQGSSNQAAAPAAAGISTDDVEKLIERAEQKKAAKKNIQEADAALTKALGADAPAFVKQKAAELGMSVEELYQIATKSPSGFLNMVGVNPNNRTAAGSMYVSTNGVAGQVQTNSPIRNKSYYDKLQKEQGTHKFYMNKNLQIQMHKDMQTLGDSFFS